jgi:O-antigen ligase
MLAIPFITIKVLFFQGLVDLALPFYLYLVLKNPQYRPDLKNVLTLSILAYFGISLISGVFGVNFGQSFWGTPARGSGIFNLAHYTLFYFYILMLAKISGNWISSLTKSLIWIGTVASAYALAVRIGFPRLFAESYWPRPSSFMGNPIFFASFLIVPIFLAVLIAITEERKLWRWIYAVLAVLMLAGVYVSKTRGAYVGLAGGIFAAALWYFWFTAKNKTKKVGLAGLLLVAVAVIFAGAHYKFTDNDSQARLIQWKSALRGFSERPVLGTGPENYYIVANEYFNPVIYNFDSEWWDKPHNTWLETLVTTGVLGLAAYLVVLCAALWGLWKAYRGQILSLEESSLLLAALVAYQVQNLFVFDTASASLKLFFPAWSSRPVYARGHKVKSKSDQ